MCLSLVLSTDNQKENGLMFVGKYLDPRQKRTKVSRFTFTSKKVTYF